MKLKTSANKPASEVDLKELFGDFTEKYKQVFMHDFGESGVFIFKALGRKDFKDLLDTDVVSDFDKEEIICEQCVLYPQNYDFENCEEAGLPTELCKLILEKSLLKSSDQLSKAIHYYRDKMATDLDEQITNVIHEAFPEFTIEEISNWDVIKTADYMARSEYILHNLRGVPIVPVEQVPAQQEVPQQNERQMSMQERFQPVERREAPQPPQKPAQQTQPVKPGREKLTPEKLRELQMKFPGIDWAHDSVMTQGVEKAFSKNLSVDTTAVADRDLSGGGKFTQDDLPEAMRSRFKVIEE